MDKISKYEVNKLDNGKLLVIGESINNKEVNAPAGDYLVINGAWYVDSLPNQVVIELADGSLTKFRLTPFRKITDKDFTAYKSYHPRKCKGQPLPDYLYKFYGLQRNEEIMDETLRARVRPSEKASFMALAGGKTESEFLREIILDKIREGTKNE